MIMIIVYKLIDYVILQHRRYQFAAEIWTLSKRHCVATLAYAPAEFGQFTSDDNNVANKNS